MKSKSKLPRNVSIAVAVLIIVVAVVVIVLAFGSDTGQRIAGAEQLSKSGKCAEAMEILKGLPERLSVAQKARVDAIKNRCKPVDFSERKLTIQAMILERKWDDALASLDALGKEPKLTGDVQSWIDERTSYVQNQKTIAAEFTSAADLTKAGKWAEAAEVWQRLLQNKQLTPEQKTTREENLKIVQERMKAEQDKWWVRDDGDTQGRPVESIEEQDFLSHYPAGRKIGSLAIFDVSGRGVNTLLVVKGTAHFATQFRIVLTTTVKENNGTHATFEIDFNEAAQEMAVSEIESVRLELPEAGFLGVVWKLLEEHVLEEVPLYRKVRWAGKLLETFDPDLEGTLTTFTRQLKDRTGADWTSSGKPLDIVRRVEELQGQKIEVEYVRSLGITKIQVLNGRTLTRATLQDIAYGSSMLMDHYLFPNVNANVGSSWNVRATEVIGIAGLGYRAKASGSLTVARDKDVKPGEVARLFLKESEPLSLAFKDAKGTINIGLVPLVGKDHVNEIDYSLQSLLIHRALLHWKLSAKNIPDSFLFAGTTELTDVECKSYYEAEMLPATPTKPASAEPAQP